MTRETSLKSKFAEAQNLYNEVEDFTCAGWKKS